MSDPNLPYGLSDNGPEINGEPDYEHIQEIEDEIGEEKMEKERGE